MEKKVKLLWLKWRYSGSAHSVCKTQAFSEQEDNSCFFPSIIQIRKERPRRQLLLRLQRTQTTLNSNGASYISAFSHACAPKGRPGPPYSACCHQWMNNERTGPSHTMGLVIGHWAPGRKLCLYLTRPGINDSKLEVKWNCRPPPFMLRG